MEILKQNKKIMMYSLMKAAVDATFRTSSRNEIMNIFVFLFMNHVLYS